MQEQVEPHKRDALVALLLFACVSAGFLLYRQGACLVWNDSPNTCWFLYDRQGADATRSTFFYIVSFFAKTDPNGYRPLSSLIYDFGMRSIQDPCSPPLFWLAPIAMIHGGLCSLVYLVARRFTSGPLFALFAVAIYVMSPPVTAASWVLFAGIQPLVVIDICAGLLLYWKGLETKGASRQLCFVGLVLMMFIGPWIREFCGLLPVLIMALEALRVRRPSWLGLMAALFFGHAVYPTLIPSLTFAPSVPVLNIFQMGSLGTQVSTTETAAATLLLRIWQNMRWYAARRFLELFPPLLFVLANLSLAAQVLDKRLRGSRLWTATACAFLAVLFLGVLRFMPGSFTAVWISLGLGLLTARYSPFLGIWFLLSLLPFFKVYTEHVHLAYAMAPASIILARAAEDLWRCLAGPSHLRLALRWALAAVLGLALLDQGATALGGRAVILGICDGLKTVAQELRERVPQGSAVVGNALHIEDIRLYSRNHFRAYWTVSAGISRGDASLENFIDFRKFYQDNNAERRLYLLDMEHSGYFPGKLYHRNKYIHSMNLPKTSLGKIHSTLVRYRFFDPLRLLSKNENIPFLGPPDEVNDFYTGPARDGSLFIRECSIDYYLYELDRDPKVFLAALDRIEKDYVPDHLPTIVKEGYRGYNLLRFAGRFYAVKQGFGFDPNITNRHYPPKSFFEAEDMEALTRKVDEGSATPAP